MEGLRKRTRPQFAFNRDMKHGLHYYETLQKVLDARATKKAHILLRHKILGHREKQNYQHEYDRIRDLVHSKTIRSDTKEMLESRIKRLEDLGAKAVNNIS